MAKGAFASLEFQVEHDRASAGLHGLRGKRRDFQMRPAIQRGRSRAHDGQLAALRFSAAGHLSSDVVPAGGTVAGELSVGECSQGIRSVEMQLARVEYVVGRPPSTRAGGGLTTGARRKVRARHTSEIMSLQVAEGDVPRGLRIPLHLVLPRQFVCESVDLAGIFALDYQVNILVLLQSNYVVAESIPLTIVRHKS